MMKYFKSYLRFFIPFICLSLILTVPLSVSADSDRMVDNLDILTAEDEDALEEKLDSISASLGHDIIVVTTETLDGKSVSLYAHDYYDDNGYGMGDGDSGILLLVYINPSDKRDRQYALSLYGKADDIFSEGDLDSLEDAFIGYLADGDFYAAFNSYADNCEYIIVNDNKLSPVWIVVSLIVGAAIGGIVLYTVCSKYKSVRAQKSANSYMRRDTFHVDRSRDVYLYSHVTRRVKPQNNSSSSGSGRSSSGRSHGGRSGRF